MPGRVRRSGAGRKKITVSDPKLLALLENLIEPETRGDPESPLRWICKSTRTLAAQLTEKRHPISHEKVAQFLRDQNYCSTTIIITYQRHFELTLLAKVSIISLGKWILTYTLFSSQLLLQRKQSAVN